RAFIDIDRYGLLESISHELGDGSVRELKVYTKGNIEDAVSVEISNVRIAEVANTIRQSLKTELESNKDVITDPEFVAERIFEWLRPKLMSTLTWDQNATARERKAAAKAVEPKMRNFEVGDQLQNLFSEHKHVVGGGVPLGISDINLLRAEHAAFVASVAWTSRVARAALFFGLAMICFALFARYLWQRHRMLLLKWGHFATLVTVFCLTICLMWVCAQSDVESRLEIVPIVLFSMTIAIAYQIGLAIMMSTLAVLLFTIARGFDLPEFVILGSASCAAGLFCQSIRSRTKSVYIGLFTAAVVFPVSVAIQFIMNAEFHSAYLVDAIWYAGGAGFAGLVLTALLPFLERWFDIQTDISLLELSDPNHPLLKQLVQRAPGTYNHSINVASIAETAADAIGANGLMCRVGAYFHDIGKMRKPEYFVENQGEGSNKHDELEPTMSRLVIVSHVKDGMELAKKFHLPRRIIDLIEQHHGTTIVAFFYHRAAQQSIEPERVDESSFRYPGPKPQTPEAAVLMLADAVEGACRSLREPGPSRIENTVREITKAKLDDGQFDQCNLTIQQLRTIQASLTKSLNAMYHGRIRYPDPIMAR
ncbi:MAG: HDIG domain-containing metalloprotein, partial [Pirellulaceae bacterium]